MFATKRLGKVYARQATTRHNPHPSRRLQNLAGRHFSRRLQPALPKRNLPPEIRLQPTIPHRAPRSHLRPRRQPPHPLAPAHLLQWHHLPRPARPLWLVARAQCRERLCESAEHAVE
ncbi:hypothetical protein SNOG_04402 [Parastagonospora nodorum SN15]|uniref:Uncharacterized protein n=1 Tax=Phaeosphaeria nodorum (strain SN15 / ATCC MYA-4574 / FGSC 10173) TaxID=321614 RepID=Q0UV12_PHANO|nr:hypothetical protein SNOG_04402 [Parastagonospora nodorum SN15]EAT88162.2 hypothetical protein SNOG_04402 [Parastagonospora nodorum SN15]